MDRGYRRRFAATCAAGVGLFVAALWLELLVARQPDPRFQLVAFSLAVAVTALAAGPGPGLLVLGLACGAIDYLLFGPGRWLEVASREEQLVFAAFAAGWMSFSLGARAVARRRRDERDARASAEQVAQQADRVAQITSELGRAQSSDELADAALRGALRTLAADAGMLLVIDPDRTSARVARAFPAQPEGDTIPLGIGSPLDQAIEQRMAVAVGSQEGWQAYGDLPESIRLPRYAASVVLPLRVRNRVAALLRLDFDGAREVRADEQRWLDVLAHQAGHALDRAWRYESAERARVDADLLRARADAELAERQKTERALRASETGYRALAARLARKQMLTAALSEARTVTAVAEEVVHHGLALAGASAGVVFLLEADGSRLRVLHAPDATAAGSDVPLEPGLCATEALRTGAPVFVASWVASQGRYWRSASLAADAGYRSSATLPLVAHAPIGVLEFHFSAPVHFDEGYQALLVSVAQHCAQALDRAQAHGRSDRARAEAEAANRMKDEFLSTVSHELRTPLNAVVGWAALLREQTPDTRIATLAVQSIHENALRQARLIEDLLDVSRLTSTPIELDVEPIELEELLQSVVNSVRPSASRGQLTVRLDRPPAVSLMGDRRRLEQVLFNVLGNAIKFTAAGGEIAIGATSSDDAVEIRVRDTGVGIEPELLPHVFDRFRQGDGTATRVRGGLGLGLSIARQLVDAHGGRITVESEGSGSGTLVRVRLPLPVRTAPATSATAVGTPVADTAPRLDGITVLVIDDEPSTREVMAHGLETCGARVACAASAAEALALLEQDPVDVLLSDVAMPDEDGYSFIARVRRSPDPRIAAIPAAAVTAYARDADRARALAAGFQLHLAKPIEPRSLARAVARLSATRSSGP